MPFDRETGEWRDEDEEGNVTTAEEDRPEVEEPEQEEAPRDIGEYQRRAQEFLYGKGDLPSPYPESGGGSTATPSPYQTPERSVYQPGPRMQEYKTAIEQMPLRQDFHPSGLRRALGIAAGIGTGLATSNPAEAAASRDISTYAPYSRQAANYQQELQKKGQLAQLEAGGNQAARQYYLDLAKIQQEQETARGRTAYQEAQRSHGKLYEAQSDPAWWAARAAAMSRTGAVGTPYTVKDSTGKTRMVTMAPGGGIKDASGTLIPPDQYDASTLKRVGTAGTEHVPTNPFELWHQQNPDKPAEEWLKLHPTSESEYADFKVGYLQQHPRANSTEIVKAFAASKEQPQRIPPVVGVSGGRVTALHPGAVVPPDFESNVVRNQEGIAANKQIQGQQAGKDALSYAETYLASGKFTGPGDEALQEKFFELAKPSSGFRMTQPQMNMLMSSRSWIDSAEGIKYHATTGQWFPPNQRKEIVDTMRTLVNSKGGGGNTTAAPASHVIPKPGEMFQGQKVLKVTEIHK